MNRRSLIAALAAMCAPLMGQSEKQPPKRFCNYKDADGTEWCLVPANESTPHDHSLDSPYWKETPFLLIAHVRGASLADYVRVTSYDDDMNPNSNMNKVMQACSICGILRVPPELQKFIGKKVIE